MAKLKTKLRTTIIQMMTLGLDPRKSLIDDFKDEILRLLPRGTIMVGLAEAPSFSNMYREFELTFDAPFFQKDFNFDVEFIRQFLDDGTGKYHQYQMATKIINLDLEKEAKNG